MFGTHKHGNAVTAPANPWKVPTNTDARESVKRRPSRGGFLLGVVSSAALVATFIGISSAASASTTQASKWELANGSVSQSAGQPTFDFTAANKARLLYSNKPGDIDNKPMSATFTVSGVNPAAVFTYAGENTPSNSCGSPASVRLFFETGGKFAYTNYWWADVTPGSAVLAPNTNGTLTADVNPTTTAWSDWNGQPSSANTAAFDAAAQNATVVGLSFGGGCFFENGVGTSDGSGSFTLNTFSAGI
jgi:hypothetical protein